MPPDRPRSKTVLVVEDDSSTRAIYRQALMSVGYTVIAVEDGLDALRYVDHDRVDAVVLDLLLPRLGGRDVYKELRANPATRRIPVVIVTGADVREFEASQFRFFLRKPFDDEALVATVDSAIHFPAGPVG